MGTRDSAVADIIDSSLTGTLEAVLRIDTLDTVSGVDVLDKGELPACGTTLAGGDGRRGQEVFPDL
jgi:hypothetical protein